MKLRPHHLLCIRAFKGKGYSSSFVFHMKEIIRRLQQQENIDITESLDSICSGCPNSCDGICASEDKVRNIDQRVISLLSIPVMNDQCYASLDALVKNRLTQALYNTICADCEWKRTGVCSFADVSGKTGWER